MQPGQRGNPRDVARCAPDLIAVRAQGPGAARPMPELAPVINMCFIRLDSSRRKWNRLRDQRRREIRPRHDLTCRAVDQHASNDAGTAAMKAAINGGPMLLHGLPPAKDQPQSAITQDSLETRTGTECQERRRSRRIGLISQTFAVSATTTGDSGVRANSAAVFAP